jgi:hypothetical protein
MNILKGAAMQLSYSISYIFEDKDWLQKLLPLVIIGVLSLIPVLGLLAAALALGWMVQLARNVRQGAPLPMPRWGDGKAKGNDWKVKFETGGQLLLAMLLYHLPLTVLSICFSTSISGLGVAIMGDFIAYSFAICCVTPLIVIYTLIIWPMLAIGVAEFIETNEWERLFRFFHLWDVLQSHPGLAGQWLLFTTLGNIVLALLVLIPCLGWLVIFLFAYPIQGHLLGQFAHRLSLVSKPQAQAPKPKKRPSRA